MSRRGGEWPMERPVVGLVYIHNCEYVDANFRGEQETVDDEV
jgi:hypothetical protein